MSIYKQLDEKTFIEFICDMEFKKDNNRDLVIHAGERFHREVELKIQRTVYEETSKVLLEAGIITSEICNNLITMINSEDAENLVVAKSYINNIQHVNNI